MNPKIIFEDDSILIVDKPSGWIVNEASTTGKTPVLQTWLKNTFNFPIYQHNECRNGIVHRLDKETSGLLVVAKTKDAFNNLQKQFKERVVSKTYEALSHGKVDPKEGTIEAPVGRLPWNRERFGVLPGGRQATTKYKTISNHETVDNNYSLLELMPRTGRTHQIRIHLKHLGHPIVSDDFYAGRKRARSDRKWCNRLFLHAMKLSFNHPVDGKKVSYETKLPDDLSLCLKSLNKK